MDPSEIRHAFVTGGASGIGLGIAEALAARGAAVTLADVDAAALERALTGRENFRGVVLDVRDREGWARAKAEAEAAFGPVDVLVNNAGIGPDGAAIADLTHESYDRILGINLTGVFNGVASFAADMRAAGRGHIVNVASVAGLFASAPGVSAYAMAKFGVVALSETLRGELAPHGVGVSVLCPGFVATNIIANTARLSGIDSDYDGGTAPGTGMSPAEAGEIVARGIAANRLYILTHPEMWPMIEARHAAIAADFAAASAEQAGGR
ncbi:SDR family oxidoreductase [Novosphingobium sp. JCM 18896]|uniref:SDR family oxidoreductase n=1 Tax=Novosphingobium sp. JCM 18896 TaxID=2989731 RepID=UPI0022215FD8|nr:SDR family oxidoreductase [Novosphingobium sp. JCM 18896]MCW1428877.1 SDR family oxidoreductase [Novosphingobium sp. JCM 18896]